MQKRIRIRHDCAVEDVLSQSILWVEAVGCVVFGDFRREEAFRVGQFLPTADQQANFLYVRQ
jgi:hypothetical protein